MARGGIRQSSDGFFDLQENRSSGSAGCVTLPNFGDSEHFNHPEEVLFGRRPSRLLRSCPSLRRSNDRPQGNVPTLSKHGDTVSTIVVAAVAPWFCSVV